MSDPPASPAGDAQEPSRSGEPPPGAPHPGASSSPGPLVYWEVPAAEPARLRVGSVLRRTFDTYGADPFLFLSLALPPALVSGFLAAFPVDDLPTVVVLSLAGGMITLVASVLAILAIDELWHGREPALGQLLARALGRTPSLLLAYVAAAVALAVPIALLVILVTALPPNLLAAAGLVVFIAVAFLALRLTPIGPVIVVERVGGLAAFGRAWRLTKGSAWRLLGLICLVVLVTLPASVGAQLVAELSPQPVLAGLAILLSTLVTSPVIVIATTIAWADLAERGYAEDGPIRRGRGRPLAMALVLGFGILLTAVGFSQGAATGFAGLVPQLGTIQAGTRPNPLDPCQLMDARSKFSPDEEIRLAGYLRSPLTAGAMLEVERDGVLVLREPAPVEFCYARPQPLTDLAPGVYRLRLRDGEGRIVGEGGFSVRS